MANCDDYALIFHIMEFLIGISPYNGVKISGENTLKMAVKQKIIINVSSIIPEGFLLNRGHILLDLEGQKV